MDSLSHFHSRNVYFYIHYSNSLKVKALNMFKKSLGSHPLYVVLYECILYVNMMTINSEI